jgi:hypothetical protein
MSLSVTLIYFGIYKGFYDLSSWPHDRMPRIIGVQAADATRPSRT